MNALAHTAEALYVKGRNAEADKEALEGARLIGASLPRVLADGDDREARRELLEGAMHAGAALGSAGLGLGHAMAQALGGRYGISHGALNAVVLAPALRFNEPVAERRSRASARRWARATTCPKAVEDLARLAGFERLRDLGVPEPELPVVAAAAAERRRRQGQPARRFARRDRSGSSRSVW